MKKRKLIVIVVGLLLFGIFSLFSIGFWNGSSQEEMEGTVSEVSSDEDVYKRAALMKESGDASVSFIKQELQLSDEQYETSIDYPQLSGMQDGEKEKFWEIVFCRCNHFEMTYLL